MDKELKDPNAAYRDEFKVVSLPNDTKRFYANGTWYNVTDRIATGRYAAYQKMSLTFGFPMNIQGLDELLGKLWNNLNNRNDADSSVLIFNAKSGIASLMKDRVQCLEMCTMFINADGEDARFFDAAVCEKKIADWNEEGIDTPFFFFHAASSAAGYKVVYEKYSPTISEAGNPQN